MLNEIWSLPLSKILLLDFRTLPTVWYFCFPFYYTKQKWTDMNTYLFLFSHCSHIHVYGHLELHSSSICPKYSPMFLSVSYYEKANVRGWELKYFSVERKTKLLWQQRSKVLQLWSTTHGFPNKLSLFPKQKQKLSMQINITYPDAHEFISEANNYPERIKNTSGELSTFIYFANHHNDTNKNIKRLHCQKGSHGALQKWWRIFYVNN